MNWKNTIYALGGMCLLASSVWAATDCRESFPGQKLNPKQDEINLPFEEDVALPGYWKAVDFVKTPDVFNVQHPVMDHEQLYLKELVILPGGEVLGTGWKWTKGHFLHEGDKTDARYEIRVIDGKKYLFLEWKSGDYTCLGRTPQYYVLERASDLRQDNVNLPFKNDKQALGRWNAIDFVFEPAQFVPGKNYWKGELYLKTLTFLPKGKTPVSPTITWTKGYVLHHADKTAAAYEIQKINGKEYMFFEWKSGDYIFRGEKPAYYVLEKAK